MITQPPSLFSRTRESTPCVYPHMTARELGIKDMAKFLGVGRTRLYELIAAQKVDRPRVIPVRRVWDLSDAERIKSQLRH